MLRQSIRLQSTLNNNTLRSIKPTKLKRKKRSLEESVSFEDFVLKGQVLHVYRDILRSIYKVPDKSLREEVKFFIKGEFKATKNVTDLNTKRSLLIGGIRQWKSVCNNMGLSYTDIVF